MNVGQELVRRLKRFTDNMENKMNIRYEPIYVSNVDCSVVPLYRSLPTAMKFLPPAPAPSESYVGAGWFKLEEDDILQEGDECEIGLGTWMPTSCVGDRVGNFGEAYRRKVTPVPEAAGPQDFLPSERWGDGREITLLRAEASSRAEIARLTAEVERLRLRPDDRFRRRVTPEAALVRELKIEAGRITTQMDQIEQLRSEVARRRLTPEERAAVRDAVGWFAAYGHAVAPILDSMLKRLGGGE